MYIFVKIKKHNFMHKFLSFTTIITTIIILSYPTISNSNTSGSVGAKTGSPSDGASCTQCHYSATENGAIITSNIPADGYIPGELYTINVDITQTGISKFGFEITSEESNFGSEKKGTFIVTNSIETKLVNNNNSITHTTAGTTGANSTKNWSFDWQAPGFASSTGGVTFYAALIGANGDGGNSGDTYHTATLSIDESSTSSTNNLTKKEKISFNANTKEIEVIDNQGILVYNMQGKIILESNKRITKLDHLNPGNYIIKSTEERLKIILN